MNKKAIIFLAILNFLSSCNPSTQNKTNSASEGESDEIGLLDVWPKEGPDLLWIYEGLGRGYGGPCISAEGIFINAEEEGMSYTVALDLKGIFKWRSPNGKEFTGTGYSSSYPGTRSNPKVKGQKVYAVSGTGYLSCFDIRNGNVIWSKDLIKDFNGIQGDFGYSETPVLDDSMIYCFPGGKVNNIVALDIHSGELIWSAPVLRDPFSYSTPVLLNLPGRKVLVGTSRNYIHVLDRQNGNLLSSYHLENIRKGNEHCNSVIYQDGSVYFIGCEEGNLGTVKLSLSQEGEALEEVWRNSDVMNVFEGFVVTGQYLHTTVENRRLVSIDIHSGKISSSVRSEYGTIMQADNKLFIYGHNGKVQLFSLEGGLPDFRSEMRIKHGNGHHFSFPVIANGVMYIRRGNALMAFAVK